MPETAGEYVDIPALLKGILNGYPGNTAIFREYLQNTDDARASSQVFVLDEREFPCERLVDPSLKGSQGPALLAINDRVLEETDWTALQKIHSSSKAQDESRTGKNGLGFRASYHLTENPHLLSGRKLVVLDAHRHFHPHAGGVSIDFIEEGPHLPDQITPFLSYLESPDVPYEGTLFRFPLRTEAQAQTSRIKDTAISVAEILELLETFCTDEAEESILFLKHVTQIKVKHVKRDGSEVILGAVEVENEGQRGEGAVYRHIAVTRRDGSTTTRTWCNYRLTTGREQASEIIKSRLGYDVLAKLQTEKLSAVVELAFPLSGPRVNGRLYTLLPLPILTGFPVHLNAVFALTPDRQSLKNLLEVGGQKSRERLLVEWNRAVFELWAPAAWTGLLVELSRQESFDSDHIWSIWPPQQLDKSTYWAALPDRLVGEAIRRRLSVFPSVPRDNLPISFVSLHDPSILLAGPNPGIPLEALAGLDVGIVEPPPYLFSIIAALRSTFKASILSPQSLYERLLKTYSETKAPPCEEKDVHVITDFLTSLNTLPTIRLVCRVPWFSCTDTDNSRVALGSVSKKYVIPLTEEESTLFSSHPRMLSWGCMSRALHAQASNPANFVTLNVSAVKPDDIVTVLNTKFRHLQPKTSEIREADHRWLIQFWTWMARWPKLDEFFRTSQNKCADLYVLPTSERSLRRLSNHSFVFPNTDAATVEAWQLLGVHPLHADLAEHTAFMMRPVVEAPKSAGYVPLLIRSCDTKAQTRLSQDALLALQRSIFEGLPPPGSARVNISSQERSRLAAMQVFRLRTQLGDVRTLGSIRGHAVYVNVDDTFPLPVQPDTDDAIYVDMADEPTARFVKLVSADPPRVLAEVDFVRIAFDHWELQSLEEKDNIIYWMFDHIAEVPTDLVARLKNIPFVEAEGTAQRVTPLGLIDPTSSLAPLYAEEVAKFPAGVFRAKYLQTMRKLGLLNSWLDVEVLKERLEYLSTVLSDTGRFRKGKHLLHLLNQSWDPRFKDLIVYARSKQWIPCDLSADPPMCLISPHLCRDRYSGRDRHENPFYYDLALSILPGDIQIISNSFREALGWLDVIRPEILVKQFRMTVDLGPSGERNERLMALIHYLGSLHHVHKLSSLVVEDLISASADTSWIPISKYGEDTVATKFALLLPDVDLKPPFFHIENFQYPAFLEEMGCTARPKFDVLVEELAHIDFQTARGVAASVSILQEIADVHPGFDQRIILVPGANNEGLPLHRVFFQDINFLSLSGGMIDLVPTHSSVSRALAESLGVPFLSALMLDTDATAGGEDENEEEEQMSEDFVNRIQGFLREYDVRYALNEFLANADDAKASEFSLMLDTPADVGERFLSPAFQKLAGCSRLVLFNNATFSEVDFEGLRHVGLGGKRGLANTHGRHGLGALSFYYFTDVVTVISGEYVMFLDPSGGNLPPRRRGKRTALRREIKQVASQFPDQLKGYESMFNFSVGSGFFDGTLFILPLKSSISERSCTFLDVHDMVKASYKSLSANAFFFTNLLRISAYKNAESDTGDHLLWSFEAKRKPKIALDGGSTRHSLTIKHQIGESDAITEKWLIATSNSIEIPETHEVTAKGLNLSREIPLSVQLAVRTDNAGDFGLIAKSSLFSTLQLPKLISLPFHINARFAISSNRQSVVLLPAGSDNQLDPKTAYNIWILRELVPPLYLSTLEYFVHSPQKKFFYRDLWWLLKTEDDISKLVRSAFLEVLLNSNKLLFQDATSDWIPFHDAVFSASQTSQITELLTSIKAPKFVLYEHLKGMAGCKSAKTVDGQFVKRVLAAAGLKPIQNLVTVKRLDSRGIARAMEYIRKEENLSKLPLVVLTSGALVEIPDKAMPPVYQFMPPTISALFPSGRFMSHDYTLESVKRLIEDDDINIVELTASRIAGLICNELNSRDPVSQNSWLDVFWRTFPDLPARPDLALLEDAKIVQGSTGTLKLSDCKSHLVIYQSHRCSPTMEPSILNILHKFGFEIVNVTTRPILDEYLAPKFVDPITNILLCMEAKGIFNLGVLTEVERQRFSSWMQVNFSKAIYRWRDGGDLVSTQFLKQVAIWNAQTRERQMLHSVSGIKLLPSSFPADHIRPFQKAGVVLSTFTYPIATLVQFLSPTDTPPKSLSAKAIMDIVDIPRQIALDDGPGITSISNFVTSMLFLPANEVRHACLQVPDRQGYLQPIDRLFDDEVPLFLTTLNHTQPSSFVHPSFRVLHSRLHLLGLHHQVDPATFATCARAINQALHLHVGGSLELNVLFQMSDAAFDVYQRSLPGMLMMDEAKWDSIDAIGFVRRKETRRQGATYDVEPYFDEPLPLLMPPSRFVRQSMEAIAWTQRALFYEEPSPELIALNKTIGIPTARDVVEHLKVLAIRIAPHHNNNFSIIDDLIATYSWLNDHINDARKDLLEAQNLPLYLNVNDPRTDIWDGNWSRGREMVLGLHYDTARLKRVGRFLHRYSELLALSGCISIKSFDRGSAVVPVQDVTIAIQDMRTTYNDMRKAGELTDVALIPTAMDDAEAADNDPELRAHYSFLAATMPYVRRRAQGWSVSTPGKITFFGSVFGAKALLDFAYTGDFERPAPAGDTELATLLNDLLELLPIADEWDIPQLKHLLEHKIIHKYDMIQKLPHQCQIMVEHADRYNAENLKNALVEFKKENEEFLRLLQDTT